MSIGFEFNRTRSLSHALDILIEEARALGFDAVDYGFMPCARDGNGVWQTPDIQSRNFPPRWATGWQRYSRQDPYLWRCYERNLPLDWNDVKGASWLTDVQQDAISYIDNLGLLDGVSIPIHLSGRSFAFVSGLSHAPAGRWRDDAASAVQNLFVLAHAFHAAVTQHVHVAADSGGPPLLTRRETEVLQFAAMGLSAPATARANHRSVETVRRQRKSAMQKLNAHTIAQAVARAISLGLLEPAANAK